MPRNDHEITDRAYSRLRAVLYVSLAFIVVCLGLNGVFFGVELFSQRSLVTGEWAVALLSQAMAIAFAIIFLFAYRKLRALEAQLTAIAPFFKNSVYLWPKDVFDRNGARLLNRKKGGLVVALHIRGLESEIVSFYGQDELRQVNTFIYESIKASMDMLAPGGGYCFAGGYLGAIGDTSVMHKNEMVMRAYGELCTRYYGG